MVKQNNTINVFFVLLRAGLWERDINLSSSGEIDFRCVYQLAQEQAVLGLVAAGLEHVVACGISKKDALQFAGGAMQLERKNSAMNVFIGDTVEKMQKAGIEAILMKGQGIAQCYNRPLWRACGDVDFFLDESNYCKAKSFLLPMASSFESEGSYEKHLGMTIDSWVVELHGTLRSGISQKIDKGLDELQNKVFNEHDVRIWRNGEVEVFLPSPDIDSIYIFTHILQHYFKGGIGLRQVCDWCRLLWTYNDTIDVSVLEKRIQEMGLLSEWKAFGAFAVDYLGMPDEKMPLYSQEEKWKRKAKRICEFIIEVGNFGHNRDMSYYNSKPYLVRKAISFVRRCKDLMRHMIIFPIDALRFMPIIVFNGLRAAARGE